jgi:hypothetical protein
MDATQAIAPAAFRVAGVPPWIASFSKHRKNSGKMPAPQLLAR